MLVIIERLFVAQSSLLTNREIVLSSRLRHA
jgi:hypothetical protein